MTLILRLFNQLTKLPGFFTLYLWLKFRIYRRQPPKKYFVLTANTQNIEDDRVLLKYEHDLIEMEGEPHDLRITMNIPFWPTVLRSEFNHVKPNLNKDRTINFGDMLIETKGNHVSIKDSIEIEFYQSKGWTRLLIRHKMDYLYGLGEKNGSLDKSGKKWKFWNIDNASFETKNDPLYKSYPLLILSNKETWIAIILDYPGYQLWDLEKSNLIQIDLESREFILHITTATDPKSLSRSITRLLGQMELPPIWALGYHQSRWSYFTSTEAIRIAKTLREKNIPCDAIYLDIDYMESYKCFTWDEKNFGNLPKLISDLHMLNFKVILMIDPGIKVDETYNVYTEGRDKGYFCLIDGEEYHDKVWPGTCAFPDFFREDVRLWWKEKYQEFIDIGVDGFFNDMNEISTFNLRGTMPDGVKHRINYQEVDHYKVHNLYSQMMAKASYEGIRSLISPKRTFLLIRSSYLGSQKFGFIWTGDNKSAWDHLAQSIPKLINSGLSGHFANGSDVGGFRENPDPELFVRWTQLSVFYPFCRNHTAIHTNQQEPWEFGPEIEEISRVYISLRYKLLPYLYTWFRYAARIGVPLLRPLWMEYPKDILCYNEKWSNTQFFFGPHIMVAPILNTGNKQKEIYLPVGIWHEFHTEKKFSGGQTIMYTVTLDRIPIFVKEGTIIPIYAEVGYNAEDTMKGDISFLTFGSGKEGYLYKDDGSTNQYLEGNYQLFKITENLELEQIDSIPNM